MELMADLRLARVKVITDTNIGINEKDLFLLFDHP